MEDYIMTKYGDAVVIVFKIAEKPTSDLCF